MDLKDLFEATWDDPVRIDAIFDSTGLEIRLRLKDIRKKEGKELDVPQDLWSFSQTHKDDPKAKELLHKIWGAVYGSSKETITASPEILAMVQKLQGLSEAYYDLVNSMAEEMMTLRNKEIEYRIAEMRKYAESKK